MNSKIYLYSLDPKITISSLKSKSDFDGYDFADIQNWMKQNNVYATIDLQSGSSQTAKDTNFHYKFNLIQSPPYIIYYMGNLSLLNSNILGIVGPRKKTFYSDKVLDKLFGLAKNYNLVTISGMAPGVDQLGHSLSIKHNIPTIAVLGGGLRWFLQQSDRNIISQIIQNGGLVLSEFKLDFKPTYYSFPQRNRIIAGLCDVLFLPQAGFQSGSLITVDFAINSNKPVYGVPDSIFSPESVGINQYIADKKINLVSDFDKFLSSHFSSKTTKSQSSKNNSKLSSDQKKILTMISQSGEISMNELCCVCDIPHSQIFGLLTTLEIQSLIYQTSPDIYKLL